MVVRLARPAPPLECVRLYDLEAGLDGFIAIHSTTLGPGAGGCRLWSYPDMRHALGDAMRLAEGMSYKNALAGLPLGGAKAVLRRPEGEFDRVALFRAFGRAVENLGGLYVIAEDVGTSVADMQEVASVSRHVAGLPSAEGRAGGDPSPWTAKGVFESMRVAARICAGARLEGADRRGAGHGQCRCRSLSPPRRCRARISVIADPDPARRDRLGAILGARVVDVDAIAGVDADIFAPCALGGALNPETVGRLKAKLVCGAANNQLASPDIAALLLERGIAYAPDYVVNAGGIINVSAEYLGEDEADVELRVAAIGSAGRRAPRTRGARRTLARRGRRRNGRRGNRGRRTGRRLMHRFRIDAILDPHSLPRVAGFFRTAVDHAVGDANAGRAGPDADRDHRRRPRGGAGRDNRGEAARSGDGDRRRTLRYGGLTRAGGGMSANGRERPDLSSSFRTWSGFVNLRVWSRRPFRPIRDRSSARAPTNQGRWRRLR